MENLDKLREECGVVAVHGHPDAARQAYLALYALQHRGQESAGIATADYTNLYNIKGMGLVADIFTDDVLGKLPGELAIGHTRYSTTGDSALLNAQPIRVDSTRGLIAIAHNGNLVDLGTLRTRLEREGAYFQTTSDSEIIIQLIAHSNAGSLIEAIGDSLRQVTGAFSIVMMTRDRIFAARDPYGFRPLSMGRISNPDGPDTVVFASETCAFDLLRAKYERDVRPGEVVMVTREGVTSVQYSTGVKQASCIFEHVYFARPDSRIFGRWVQASREQMGRRLAIESPVDADLVVPVPDSGVTAALGYAAQSGSCPPTISPCYYGVDTPNKSELIAANASVEEIRQYIEADSLSYLSLDGLEKACDGGEGNHYCTACYTGEYPTQWVDVSEILPATTAAGR
jgi:amidophosphoribosyltransferase